MTETRSKTHKEHLRKMDKEMGDLSAAYKAVSNKVESSYLTLKVLCNRQERFENIMTEMNKNYENLVAMMAQISGGRNDTKDKEVDSSVPQNMFGPGTGSRKWLMEARKYFQLHQVIEELKAGIAKMYLNGKADIWFHGFASFHPDWNVFAEELCKRFTENTGEEVVEIFSKLRQFGTISEYQERFEELKAQVMMSIPH
ncbi:Uncharacterized protein Adt_20679 [Abeliophyllum distichum]|uniref:Retrotransposon gag domain-containing protein n=1 Tax=Abeliophyllum distichum TaxID=126358 RepID=A0ABD1SXA5_9LAMI